jgi:hypothetical protein
MKAYKKANRELLNYIKTSMGCQICGYNANPLALQLDHIDPSTKFVNGKGKRINPSDLVSYSQATLLAEVKKCRVLCANCHSIYTHSEQRKK